MSLIRNDHNKRVFLQWFALALAYVTALFFLSYEGLIAAVWQGDVTHMTSVIAVVFVVACGYIGFASWRYDDVGSNRTTTANADIGVGRSAAFLVTLIGLLGTTIGLMLQVKAMGSIDLSNPQKVVTFIATIGNSLSTALYATATGITGCIGITLMNLNLEYFVDREDSQ